MKRLLATLAAVWLGLACAPTPEPYVTANFQSAEGHRFTEEQRARVTAVLEESARHIARDFPQFTDPMTVEVAPIVRPAVDALGGVTGRADRPGGILIEISTTFDGGVSAAIEEGLLRTATHEMHHLVRGWTIERNRFGPGIAIATANEGLAEVYSELIAGPSSAYEPLDDATFTAWAEEILALPVNASYGDWMFSHPDGREAVGYRTGAELVRRAMAESGLSIIELTERSPQEIWELAGFSWPA